MYAGFVDAGFLKAAGAKALSADRRKTTPDASAVVTWFEALGDAQVAPPPLLRTYWYDGALDPSFPGYDSQRRYFDAIANTAGIQLRLGHLRSSTPPWHHPLKAALRRLNVDLEEFEKLFPFKAELSQKGVDSLIVLDLVRLADRRAYDTAILVAGDRDLAEAVRTAQDSGRRIVLAVPEGGGVAKELRQLADAVHTIPKGDLAKMLTVKK